VLNGNEPKPEENVKVDVFYGLLNFREKKGEQSQVQISEQNPVIVVSASYDALSISPELSYAMSSSGTGVIALLQLSKIFSQVVSELTPTAFKFDLLFVLSPSSSLNYDATSKFIDNLQGNIKERIRLVLCLDGLAADKPSDQLYLHKGGLANNDAIANKFIQEFKKACGKRKVKADVIETSTQVGFIQHEHQIYSEKGLPAITLSTSKEKLRSRWEKFSVFDKDFSNQELSRNILIAGEALIKLIYQFNERNINFFIDNDAIVSQ